MKLAFDHALVTTDSALVLALDRESVRVKDRDGRLRIARAHISKANVCPYRGDEIPGWEELKLDRNKVYNLLRDPDELAKAAESLNGVPLLRKHIPVSAEDHQPHEVVGSLGTDAEFDGEYLDNSLFVNAADAIKGIESNKKRELSAGYHYKPDMTPGKFRGSAYDGVMRDIVFNHVALVEDGRAGPDVVVGDEALKEIVMKPTRFAVRALALTGASIAPLLAMDSVTLSSDLFAPLTTKNFKDNREKLLAGVRSAIDGKLRKGIALDATMKDFAKAIDTFNDDMTAGIDAPTEEDVETAAVIDPIAPPQVDPVEEKGGYDAEPVKAFLKSKGMADDDIAKVCDMLPKNGAMDADETDEEKAAREKKEADEKAAKDAEMKDMVSKPAMDAAINAATVATEKRIRETERGIRAALSEVKPWAGDLSHMAFDSAADVHRAALVAVGVPDAKTLHADALLPILKAQKKPGARQEGHEPALGMDAATIDEATKMAPGLARIVTGI